MKFLKIIGLLIIIAIAFEAGVIYQKRQPAVELNNPSNPGKDVVVGITVRAAHPQRRDMRRVIRATGTLEPVDKADVYAKVPGDITEIHAEEGDKVLKGQLLAKIDDRELKLAVDRAETALSQALVSSGNMESTLNRNRRLFERGLISEQEFDSLRTQHRVAKQQVQSARTALEQARLKLSYSEIRSPLEGTVTRKDCELYRKVSSAERLFRVAILDPLRVRVRVTEKEVSRISVGENPVTLEVDALSDTKGGGEFTGDLSFVGPVVDSRTGTVEVRVRVSNADGALTSGMFSRVYIQTDVHPATKVVLKQALLGEEGAHYVFVVRPGDGNRPVAHRVEVKAGISDDKYAEILSDKPSFSDWVIVEGQNLLSEGDRVVFAGSSEEGEPMPKGFTPAASLGSEAENP